MLIRILFTVKTIFFYFNQNELNTNYELSK